jgi:uncharacterized protein involved in exopolysaccharide biosynthesis
MDDADVISRIAALEQQVRALETRTSVLNDLLVKVTELCTKVDSLIATNKDLSQRLTAIEKEPADKWGLVTRTVITVAITAAVTYFGTRFFGK